MTQKLSCPVCERSEIETNTCPNCETDLSTIRMLIELPTLELNNKQKKPQGGLILVVIGLIIVASIIGSLGGYIIAQNTSNSNLAPLAEENNQYTPTSTIAKTVTSEPKIEGCGGFYYRIKSGDSLSLIASRFYGDAGNWELIMTTNSQLKSPEYLTINEVIFIPNLKELCPQNKE